MSVFWSVFGVVWFISMLICWLGLFLSDKLWDVDSFGAACALLMVMLVPVINVLYALYSIFVLISVGYKNLDLTEFCEGFRKGINIVFNKIN